MSNIFTVEIEKFFRKFFHTKEASVSKRNHQFLRKGYFEVDVEIEDKQGGRLVLTISILVKSANDIIGEIVETWYWDASHTPDLVVGLFFGEYKKVVITFTDDNCECVMKNYYGWNIL